MEIYKIKKDIPPINDFINSKFEYIILSSITDTNRMIIYQRNGDIFRVYILHKGQFKLSCQSGPIEQVHHRTDYDVRAVIGTELTIKKCICKSFKDRKEFLRELNNLKLTDVWIICQLSNPKITWQKSVEE